jgi:acetyl esterase/lipase
VCLAVDHRPEGSRGGSGHVSLHGSGFVVGSIYMGRKLFDPNAKGVGVRAPAPDYRRPAEHLRGCFRQGELGLSETESAGGEQGV